MFELTIMSLTCAELASGVGDDEIGIEMELDQEVTREPYAPSTVRQ